MSIDRAAIELLLTLLEAPEPVLSGSALRSVFPKEGAALIEAGLVVHDGYEMAATVVEDHSDLPVEVIPNESGTGYGYFSGTVGWVPINSGVLVRFRVEVAATLQTLLPLDTRLSPASSATHIEGTLWNGGTIDLRGRRTELWLARRLFDPEVYRQVGSLLAKRPSPRARMVLTSTPSDRLRSDELSGALVVSIQDVLGQEDPRIDPRILATRLDGDPAAELPIWLSPDGSRLVISGADPITFRSEKQRALIRLLVDAYVRGERRPARTLLDEASSGATALPNAFGAAKWKLLKPYLKSRQGLWGFEPDNFSL